MAIATFTIPKVLTGRLTGPGGLYNLGNALGLLSGLSLHVVATLGQGSPDLQQGLAAVADYLVGSAGAVALTLAMLIFFWSGEHYHRAWDRGFPPDPALNRSGDLSSGLGALVLGLGLFLMGDPLLAATAGLLHALGKFGSALPHSVQRTLHLTPRACRLIVVASRIPAVILVMLSLDQATSAEAAFGALSLLGCYGLWLWADLILLRAID